MVNELELLSNFFIEMSKFGKGAPIVGADAAMAMPTKPVAIGADLGCAGASRSQGRASGRDGGASAYLPRSAGRTEGNMQRERLNPRACVGWHSCPSNEPEPAQITKTAPDRLQRGGVAQKL